MKTSDSFFVIQNVNKGNGKLRVAGQFLINGGIEVVSSPGSQPEDQQPKVTVEVSRMFEVKWILPPPGLFGYDVYMDVKAAAEGAGYETVDHDDFSYPPR